MIYKKVTRHGNTLAIVLPKQWLRDLSIAEGDYVIMAVHEGDMIIIKKAVHQNITNLHTAFFNKKHGKRKG